MPILQHHPWVFKSYSGGANTDHNKELSQDESEYVDSRNGRLRSGAGKDKILDKIKGEVVLYPKNFNTGDYFCIGAWNVNEDTVEFWTDKNYIEDPLIRVNGQVVCKSAGLGFRADRPLQGDTNDSCVGGEIFVTDYEQPIFIFNIKDMVDSLAAGSTKYFSGFNADLYKATLKNPLDIPAFIELVSVGGGGGLPYGSYSYSIRYVTEEGDRTNFSVETPTIDVPAGNGTDSYEHRWIKTFGGAPAPSVKGSYGIKIKFRVTNLYNYNYIEVRRVAYNQGAGLTSIPSPKIVARIPITAGQIDIITFIDPSDAIDPVLTIADNEDLQQFSTFNTCKTLRYYNKRLVPMNIKYPSRKVDGVRFLEDSDGTSGFPIIYPLGDRGHSDAFLYAYRKDLISGERHNYGAVIFDGSGGPSFVVEMTDPQMTNIKTAPNHRDPLGAKALNYCVSSGLGAPQAADVTNSLNYVYEIWDLKNAVTKEGNDIFNICNEGHVIGSPADPYSPLTPKNDGDPDVLGHRFRINDEVRTSALSWTSYRPKGFAPNYWTRGITIKGLDAATLPNWAKAFAIVKSKPAKRVVCQGIGIYKLTAAVKTSVGIGYSSGISKALDTVWFHSPDLQHGFVDGAIVADMQANPTNYKVQLISPVGYFSEVYNNIKKTAARDRSCDIITYARIQDENGTINPTENSGQVEFGNYLNVTPGTTPASGNGNFKFGLVGFTPVTEGRNDYFVLTVDNAIYSFGSQGGSKSQGWDINEGKDFKEPFYIINIIRDGAQPPKGNTTNYYQTGHYQKIVSIIGKADGNPGKYDLVDERLDDCMPNFHDPNKANIDTYLFIEDTSGVEHVWLNVQHKTAAQKTAIFNTIQSAGFYNSGPYQVEGVYNCYKDSLERFYGVEFVVMSTTHNSSMFIPEENSLIKIRYDDRFPLAVYPGDHYIGETVFFPIDRYSPGNENEPDETQQFLFGSGLPYHGYKFNTNYFVQLKSYGAGNNVQDLEFKTLVDYIRQWAVMYPTEARACQPLMWGDKFPNVNYVMRPNKYKITSNMCGDNNKMYCQYFTDYPGEENSWGYGGFHVVPSNNGDYSVTLNDRIYTSKPLVGFKEQTDFCSRIIWSLERQVNAQDSPGLKTFPALNVKDISDNQGCIKYAYDANTGKGSNLYAVCGRGICLMLTNKSTLSDANAGQIAYMQTENFINEEYWLSKDVGMDAENWRTAAEVSALYGDSRIDTLFFVNRESAFSLVNNEVKDISKAEFGYHSTIFDNISSRVLPDYMTHLCAGYDRKHEEYWVHIDTTRDSRIIVSGYTELEASFIKEDGKLWLIDEKIIEVTNSVPVTITLPEDGPEEGFFVIFCNSGTSSVFIKNSSGAIIKTINPGQCFKISFIDGEYVSESYEDENEEIDSVKKTYVFNQIEQSWTGYLDYSFDKFLSKYHNTYGLRDLEMYNLNEGYSINGGNIAFEAVQSYNPDPASDKEFIRVKINSSSKPTRVEFLKEYNGPAQSWLDSSQGPLYLKDYRGYEQYVPRTDSSVAATRPRIQGRLIFTKIFHILAEDFSLISSGIQYKKIK